MNRKERRLALKSALAYKYQSNELIVVDNIEFKTNKTKEMLNLLEKLNIANKKVIVVIDTLDENICLSARNLANVKVLLAEEVNTLDLVSADNMLITQKALAKLEEARDDE